MRLLLGLILVLFVVQLPSTNGLNFLFYNPKIGRSHVLYMGKLADVLSKAGHEVVNYQVVHSNTYSDTGTKHSQVIRWEPQAGNQFNFSFLEDRAWKGVNFWALLAGMDFSKVIQDNCEHQLEDTELIAQLKAKKFDFAFTEFMDLCGFLLFEKVGVKRYAIVSAPALSMMMMGSFGVPNAASFVPDTQFGGGYPPFNFIQRLQNSLSSHMVKFLFKGRFIDPYTVMGNKHLRKDFDIMEKVTQAQLIFVNVDEHLDFPRPITHKIHYIGGIGMKKPEPLTGKYAEIFEKGDKFIYMSFGTMAPSIISFFIGLLI